MFGKMELKILVLIGCVFSIGVTASETQDEYDDSDMYMEPMEDHLPASSNAEPQVVSISNPESSNKEEPINASNKETAKEDLGPLVAILNPEMIISSKLDDTFEDNTTELPNQNKDKNSEVDNETPTQINNDKPLKNAKTSEEDSNTQKNVPEKSQDTQIDVLDDAAQPIITVVRPQEPQIASSDLQGRDTRSWYPGFGNWEQPPLGHSRPVYNTNQQPEGAYSQRSDPPYHQQLVYAPQKFVDLRGYKDQFRGGSVQQQVQSDANVDILGDGNFGVIQGGTFYPEKDSYDAESSDHFDDFSYFGPNNGHGRPSSFYYGGKPNPKPYTHKQFENFRDFAEINAGVTPDRQYSHYVVVYTNKNATNNAEINKDAVKLEKPKNIMEQLAMIDLETQKTTTEESIVEKKLSKSKRKLALVLPEKKHKAKLIKKEQDMQNEPLLALS